MSFFTIYTYGNYGTLYNILVSMSMFFYQGGSVAGFMQGMVKMASIIAILTVLLQWVGLTMYQKGNGFDLLFFVRFYLLYAFLVMTPTTRTLIVDSTVGDGATDLGAVPVNMPLPMGVIFINSVTSSIFHSFIIGYQKYFGMSSNPDNNYTRSGLAFGSAFMSNLPNINIGTVDLQQNLQTYITHCALPIINRTGGLPTLVANSNLLSALDIGTSGNNRWVEYITPGGISTIISCSSAYKNVTGALNTINPITSAITATGATGTANTKAPSDAQTEQKKQLATIFLNAANTSAAEFSNSSATGSDLLKQSMTINMLRQGIRREAARYDATATANAAYDAIQFQQYQSGSQLSGEQAGRVVPALQNFAFTLLFMLYPILVLMALLTSSFNAITKYVKFSATIACIPFIYELLNSVIYMYAQAHNTELATNGLTMMNSVAIYSLNANIVAAANYLSMATPAIAYMIISGSDMAITSVMGHSTQPAQSQASSVGQQQAHGDMRAGQFSMDTYAYNLVAANKFDQTVGMKTGADKLEDQGITGSRTSLSQNGAGKSFTSDATGYGNLAANVNWGKAIQSSLNNSKSQVDQDTRSVTTQSQNLQTAVQNATKAISSDHTLSDAEKHSRTQQLQDATKLQLGFGAGAFGFKAGAEKVSALVDGWQKGNDTSDSISRSTQEAYQNLKSASDSYSKTVASAEQHSFAHQKLQSLANSDSAALSMNYSSEFNDWFTQNVVDKMGDKFTSLAPAQQMQLEQKAASDFFTNKANEAGLNVSSLKAPSQSNLKGDAPNSNLPDHGAPNQPGMPNSPNSKDNINKATLANNNFNTEIDQKIKKGVLTNIAPPPETSKDWNEAISQGGDPRAITKRHK
jgi:hypothetical protein